MFIFTSTLTTPYSSIIWKKIQPKFSSRQKKKSNGTAQMQNPDTEKESVCILYRYAYPPCELQSRIDHRLGETAQFP